MLNIDFCISIVYDFILLDWVQGPYVDNKRTYLQKIVGDGNILIVKFADIPGLRNSADNFGMPCMFYRQVAEDGILLGLRRYRFFSKFSFYGMRNLFRSILNLKLNCNCHIRCNTIVQGCKHTALSLYLLEMRQSEILLEEEIVPVLSLLLQPQQEQ